MVVKTRLSGPGDDDTRPAAPLARRLVVRVQCFVQLDGRFMGLAFHRAGLGIATEQQVGLAGQVAGLDHFDQLVVFVQQFHLGASGHVQARLLSLIHI